MLRRAVYLLLFFSLCFTAQADSVSKDSKTEKKIEPPIENEQPTNPEAERHKIDQALRAKLLATITQASSFEDRFDAEVWLVQKSAILEKYVKDPDERFFILKEVHSASKLAGVPPEFVLAVIQIESAFDRFAISRVGAQGMMQIMPFWKNEIGREEDNLMDVQTNLRYGCTILKHYLDRADGNWGEALARYNGSYGKYWYPQKVMVAWEKNWR